MDKSSIFFAPSPRTIIPAIVETSPCAREEQTQVWWELNNMLAVRVALSNPDKSDARERHLDDHKRHLRSGSIKIIQSGPILDAAGTSSGGVVVAEVGSLDDMVRFSSEDPFVCHEIYSTVSIFEWRPTIGSHS
ncbi:hypothetical protein FHX08_005599 [Rhizobium sp. BK529]|uniref:YciI family protein n=1 Tax=Rhizobium sp. BK529 TaxID=2586983 RepID=UPI00161CA9DA|nr:YciI family protein [Rhizobium sp. BK529]MBB3595189.1 hypothetical protein [Rhizobium sp. BK529]